MDADTTQLRPRRRSEDEADSKEPSLGLLLSAAIAIVSIFVIAIFA